ncbi:hypothetical protein L202_03107 [Cryptococcus amylolentus CBS 6039]|uniref:DUF1365 domain-containing protein n=1 Tax=Cryptococcus amylolentus CBS 6039 TaxID=1295533 RepID=A0A1E3HXE3_9TREE|nr:hypothetical protein L202_03107 [Cryptococcus amylolentus CBS 6039]ODN80998.1 hypothetical protein L202_03107 [Cryptococcus amylolentus CBS 6039]
MLTLDNIHKPFSDVPPLGHLLLPLAISAGSLIAIGLGTATIRSLSPSPTSSKQENALPSYLYTSKVYHKRKIPSLAHHAFTSPAIFLCADIDALQDGALDAPLRVVRQGGHPGTKVVGLKSHKYLGSGDASYRTKLEALLERYGVRAEEVGKVWMTTMPSLLGFEGLNPLTTWYVYGKAKDGQRGELKWLVLEVHTEFGESHAYVLGMDSPLRHEPARGYDFAFTFPRSFHVSPFNDRSGFYRLDILDPFPLGSSSPSHIPRFKTSIQLLTPHKDVKLAALMVPGRQGVKLGEGWSTVRGVLGILTRWPGALLLVSARTKWEAYKLHYRHKLALYPKPEPRCPFSAGHFNPPEPEHGKAVGYGLQGRPLSDEEKKARRVVEEWVKRRVKELGVRLEVVFAYEREALSVGEGRVLSVKTADPVFFTNLLMAPSPRHFLFLAFERLTVVSDASLFVEMFEAPEGVAESLLSRWTRSVHSRHLAYLTSTTTLPPPASLPPPVAIPPHFTASLSTYSQLSCLRIVSSTWVSERLVEWVFDLLGGTFLKGHEPWGWALWDRAARRAAGEQGVDVIEDEREGSVLCVE